MAKKVVLAGACRTAIGTMGGTLSTTPAPELGAIVIKEALKRAGVAPEAVDQVYMGCVIQAGQGQNVARQAAIKAGLPIEVPAVTMNVVCGSGLNCVNQAAQMIMAGDADIVVAGGMENMSMAPYAIPQGRYGYRMGNATMVDTMIKDALWDAFNDYHMIKTADNICEEWGLTREELDEFALKSQLKAEEAQKNGAFKAEIVPVEVKKKKETIVFDTDEGPRHGSTIEGLAKLRAINPGGFVTAGNASGINDGAAAIVVMSEEKAKELGVKPMATFVAGALSVFSNHLCLVFSHQSSQCRAVSFQIIRIVFHIFCESFYLCLSLSQLLRRLVQDLQRLFVKFPSGSGCSICKQRDPLHMMFRVKRIHIPVICLAERFIGYGKVHPFDIILSRSRGCGDHRLFHAFCPSCLPKQKCSHHYK